MLSFYALDSPQAALREGIAQLLFWSGLGCLPASIALFVATLIVKQRWKHLVCAFTSGLLLTHFLWYFTTFSLAVSHTHDKALYPSWFLFAPIGFCVAMGLILFRLLLYLCATSRT